MYINSIYFKSGDKRFVRFASGKTLLTQQNGLSLKWPLKVVSAFERERGAKVFELSNHLGNVLVTVSDRKNGVDTDGDNEADYYEAEVLSASDYYPFGWSMPGRKFNSGDYRFGYQGSEKDDELKGEGNSYSTFFRQLDPRVGRWLSIDPKSSTTPWESPYMSMGGNPILNLDPLGDKWFDRNTRQRAKEMRKSFRDVIKDNNTTMTDRNEARAGLKELKVLRKDKMKVRISVENVAPRGAYFSMSNNGAEDMLEVVVPFIGRGVRSPNGYRNRSMAHELKHAYKYLKGEISFTNALFPSRINGQIVNLRGVGTLYDVGDEYEAFIRGQVFDKTGWGGWGFFKPRDIRVDRLSLAYRNRPLIQISSKSQMERVNIYR